MSALAIGDKVTCRLFNKPEGKFYDEFFRGVVIDIVFKPPYGERMYRVKRQDGTTIDLHRKEIKGRIKK